MDNQFEILLQTRKNVQSFLNHCSEKELYHIPEGFNNNIFWQAAHLVATQQSLIYGLTQSPYTIEKSFIDAFRGGTKPTGEPEPEALAKTKELLVPTMEQLRKDYLADIFGPIKPLKTRYRFDINTVEQAITFLNIHEAMHFGQMRSLKQLISA